MPYTTIISPVELAVQLQEDNWAVIDCRFSLSDPEAGRRAYQQSHIPGAVYAHLDEDLSGYASPGRTSRHPLPNLDAFVKVLSQWGIDEETQVVAYDDMGGAIAARLWWMLRWLGHESVAVLDGGWQAWEEEHRPTTSGIESRQETEFEPNLRPELVMNADEVMENLESGEALLVDARTPVRFRGEEEPHDPVAGHIPGAVNFHFAQNLDDGSFLPPRALRQRYEAVIGDREAGDVVFYCGSGVTAAHNALALLHAGLGEARLYPGSWSEWITDPERPIETDEPETGET